MGDLVASEVVGELKVLLHGLWISRQGSAAASTLPSSAPQFQRDALAFLVFAVIMLLFNWTARFILVEPFLSRCLGMKGKKREKFAQSFMETVFYGGFTVIGLLVVPRQEWIWPSSLWWIGFAEGGHEVMRSDLRCYYLMYAARYFQGGVSVLFEHKRKDFLEMQIHHWTTVVLIYISYFYGWNRIGCCVMLLLDPADAILHTAKMCKYMSDSIQKGKPFKGLWQNGADVCFALFALVFFVTRLVIYPYVCWSAHIEATKYFAKGAAEWTCVALLEILLVLQCYWFYLLCRAIHRMLILGAVEDVRSDSEDEPEHTNGKKHE
jgi:ceramide synthetase